jgi:uncharacterized protein
MADFMDPAQKTRMKAEQRAWIASRERCGDDGACIGKLYRDQLSTLTGADPAHRFSGLYEVKDIGFFVLYPVGNRYLVNIQTADQRDWRWECELWPALPAWVRGSSPQTANSTCTLSAAPSSTYMWSTY